METRLELAPLQTSSPASGSLTWATYSPMSIKPTELPEALKRKATKHREMANKRHYGASISTRPEIACLRLEEGHWEGDTMVGKRAGQ